jgi:rhodanese-related sulfurtransferase
MKYVPIFRHYFFLPESMESNPADEILPGLWLGNRHAALDPEYLRERKIRAVFNCTKDIPFEKSIPRQYRVPVDDNLQAPEIRNLELWSYEIVYKIMAEMRQAKKENTSVLVHCAAGMQRSAASMAMYLIAAKGMRSDEAMAFIKERRPIAFRPSANFEKAIRGFETSFEKEIRPKLLVSAKVKYPERST